VWEEVGYLSVSKSQLDLFVVRWIFQGKVCVCVMDWNGQRGWLGCTFVGAAVE